MRVSIPAFAAASVALLTMATATSAAAQQFQRDRNQSVEERPRPEYEATGLPLGGFRAFPAIEMQAGRDTDLFPAVPGKQDDSVLQLRPSLGVESQWSRNSLRATAVYERDSYGTRSSEDADTYALTVDGRADIQRGSSIGMVGAYGREKEARTDNGSPTLAAEPVQLDRGSLSAYGAAELNRLRFSGRFDWRDLDYTDVPSTAGGVIDQDQRDRRVSEVTARGEYAISPATSVFVDLSANQRRYRLSKSRNSDGVDARLGVNFESSALVRGELAVGYVRQDYEPGFRDISGFSYAGRLEWFPTQLITFTLAGQRSIEESVLGGAGGFIRSQGSVRADYELLRQLILNAEFGVTNDRFRGIDREEQTWRASLGGRYYLTRAVRLEAGYSHIGRNYSGAATPLDYDIDRVSLGLRLQR